MQLNAASGADIRLQQSGETLSGTVKNGNIQFSFKLKRSGETIDVNQEGEGTDADNMKGKAVYGSMASGTRTAKRKK